MPKHLDNTTPPPVVDKIEADPVAELPPPCDCDKKGYSLGNALMLAIHVGITITALYFAFLCTCRSGVLSTVVEFLMAMICSPFYIAYRLARSCKKCLK